MRGRKVGVHSSSQDGQVREMKEGGAKEERGERMEERPPAAERLSFCFCFCFSPGTERKEVGQGERRKVSSAPKDVK